MKVITVYTDGACSGNPGPGGWAAVLLYEGRERVLSGAEPHTTNNRMELMAAIEALRALREPCTVRLHTDSTYLEKAFNAGWIASWIRSGWKTAAKKPVENRDLWEQLLEAAAPHRVTWIKVKGHADDPLNNRVDELAVAALNTARQEANRGRQPRSTL